jgi:hypothetical protein
MTFQVCRGIRVCPLSWIAATGFEQSWPCPTPQADTSEEADRALTLRLVSERISSSELRSRRHRGHTPTVRDTELVERHGSFCPGHDKRGS